MPVFGGKAVSAHKLSVWRRRGFTDSDVVTYYHTHSARECAAHFKMSHQNVCRILKKYSAARQNSRPSDHMGFLENQVVGALLIRLLNSDASEVAGEGDL